VRPALASLLVAPLLAASGNATHHRTVSLMLDFTPKLHEAGRVQFSVFDIHDLAIERERGARLVGVMAIVLEAWSVSEARFGIVKRPPDVAQAFAINR